MKIGCERAVIGYLSNSISKLPTLIVPFKPQSVGIAVLIAAISVRYACGGMFAAHC